MQRCALFACASLIALAACGEARSPEVRTASGTTKKRHVIVEKASARAPLFTEELDNLRRGVAAYLAKSDLAVEVVPIETVDALYGVASSGRRRDGGPLCSIPPSAHSVILQTYPDALLAQPSVTCGVDETCELMVTLTDPPPLGKRGSYENIRTFVAKTSRLDLVRAPAQLVVRDDEGSHAGGTISLTNEPPARAVDFEHLASTGTWSKPPSLAELDAARVEAEKCQAVSRRNVSYSGDATLAVDADGAVTRCELRSSEDPSSPERSACYCRALRTARFQAGRADRRVALYVFEHPAGGGVVANGKTFNAGAWLVANDGDGGVVQTADANEALSVCSRTANEKLRFKASVDVDATGKVVGASADGEPKAAKDCVVAALLKVRSTCTRSGNPRRIPIVVGGTVEPE